MKTFQTLGITYKYDFWYSTQGFRYFPEAVHGDFTIKNWHIYCLSLNFSVAPTFWPEPWPNVVIWIDDQMLNSFCLRWSACIHWAVCWWNFLKALLSTKHNFWKLSFNLVKWVFKWGFDKPHFLKPHLKTHFFWIESEFSSEV